MKFWNYGLVKNEKGIVFVYEIFYNDNNKPYAYADIWPSKYNLAAGLIWLIRDIPMMITDIYNQLKYSHIYTHKEILQNNK